MSDGHRSPPGRGARLVLRDEQGRRRGVVAPGQSLRLGRGPENDVVVSDAQASRFHATLWWHGGRCYIRDEGSTNGTWLNDIRVVDEQVVRPGDCLRIGSTIFELVEVQRRGIRTREKKAGIPLPVALVAVVVLILVIPVILLVTRSSRVRPPMDLLLATPPATPLRLVPTSAPSPRPPASVLALASPTPRPTSTPTATSPLSTPAPMLSPTPIATPAAAPTLSANQARDRALLAVVMLFVPVDRSDDISVGSGSIVSPEGYILTNLHIVGDPETGVLYNAEGLAYVGVNVNPSDLSEPPEIMYTAELVEADVDLDLALLQVSGLENGDPLPAGFSLNSVPVGDSNMVQIGDPISIIGFPTLGGRTVTLTKGTVSGFHAQGVHMRAWIKTDTEISPGNSGGMALNERWELIGVPTIITIREDVSSKIGWIRPVELAQLLLGLAL